MKSIANLIPALLVALGLTALGLCIKAGIDNFSFRDRIVTVRGLAEREVMANRVLAPMNYTIKSNDVDELTRIAEHNNTELRAWVKAAGIADSCIFTTRTDISEVSYYGGNTGPKYQLTGGITVETSKVKEVVELLGNQNALYNKGIYLNDSFVTYDYTDLNTIKPDMITDATRNAREAADRFAQDSDSHVGKIKTASQGQFSIESASEVRPWIMKVRVVSSIVYYLED